VGAGGQALISRDSMRAGAIGLASGETKERDLSWQDWTIPYDITSDGKIMLFVEAGEAGGGEYEVFTRETNGSSAIRLGAGSPNALSPDGKWALVLRQNLSPPGFALLPTGVGQQRTLNTGNVVPLKKLMELKDKYKFYLLLDESCSIGVLGKTGRGVTEHFGVPPTEIDFILGKLDTSLGSVGGFCCGITSSVNHLRLNASGYVFSASLPPYLAVAARKAIDVIDESPALVSQLSSNCEAAFKIFSSESSISVSGVPISPVIHLSFAKLSKERIVEERKLQSVVEESANRGIVITRSKYVDQDVHRPPASIRFPVSKAFSVEETKKAALVIAEIMKAKS